MDQLIEADGSVVAALTYGETGKFEMKSFSGSTIPRNYYCKYYFDLDPSRIYNLLITRDAGSPGETMDILIHGYFSDERIDDETLRPANSGTSTESYILMDTVGAEIYVRNKYDT